MLEELPLTGRTLLNITALAPGVTPRTSSAEPVYGRRDQYVTVEGGRDSSTNYAVDGVYVSSLRCNNMSLNPPIDACRKSTCCATRSRPSTARDRRSSRW